MHFAGRLGWVVGLLTIAVAAPAAAQHKRGGARTHDGFYLRGSLGWAVLSGTHEYAATTISGDVHTTDDLSGNGWQAGAMVGGTLPHGFVVGGALWDIHFANPAVELSPGGPGCTTGCNVKLTSKPLNLFLLGPYVAWFPAPRSGWNLDATVGFAVSNFQGGGDDKVDLDYWETQGVGVSVGGGYDFWIASQWSLGVQARISWLSGSDRDHDFSSVLPGLAADVTFH